ncbi:acetylornithine deacetylase, partial [Pseudomonas aeruginosa]
SPGKINLLASYGSRPGAQVLPRHTDTEPYDEALWSSDPQRLDERDGRWYGLGRCDINVFFTLTIESLLPLLDHPFLQPLMI